MPIKPGRSIWLAASLLGCVYGGLFSIHTWLGLFTNIELNHWLFLSDLLFISLLIVLGSMGLVFSHKGVTFGRLSLALVLCAALWGAFFLATYIVSTTVFVDQAVQIAFFKRDYTYHGYKSVAEALFTDNNASELLKLQVFSLAISMLIQWGALAIGVLLNNLITTKISHQ